MSITYRCEAASVAGFIQQLSVSYISRGYWFYVFGHIPAHKDPVTVDHKIVERYGIAISKWSRVRRKHDGIANLHYLRLGRKFVILSTSGKHAFFETEKNVLCDVRRVPIKVGGYSVGYCGTPEGGAVVVRIERKCFKALKSFFLNIACHDGDLLASEFRALQFEAYAVVRQQLLRILKHVNRCRSKAGLDPVPVGVLRLRRRSVRCFVGEPSR